MTALNSIIWLSKFAWGYKCIGIKQKVRDEENVRVDWTVVVIQLTKVYTAQNWNKISWIVQKITEFYEPIELPSHLLGWLGGAYLYFAQLC